MRCTQQQEQQHKNVRENSRAARVAYQRNGVVLSTRACVCFCVTCEISSGMPWTASTDRLAGRVRAPARSRRVVVVWLRLWSIQKMRASRTNTHPNWVWRIFRSKNRSYIVCPYFYAAHVTHMCCVWPVRCVCVVLLGQANLSLPLRQPCMWHVVFSA